jgi:murein DD-endopeptidase MepM/ murein hydrolase activator NlpD
MVSMEKLRMKCELHKLVRLRKRHILTRNNRVRLRYVAGCACALGLAVTFAFNHPASLQGSASSYQIAALDLGDNAAQPSAGENNDTAWAITQNLQNQISGGIRKASLTIKKSAPHSADLKIGRGDTIAGVLEEAGISDDDAFAAVKALSKHVNPRQVQPGQVINVEFKPGAADAAQFARMSMEAGPLKKITIRKENDRFVADLQEKEVKARTYAGYAKIQNSLYGSAERAGIPAPVLADVIRLYSRNIDFQRDIRQGDEIEVMYDGEETEDGAYRKYGNIVYANLTVGGKSVPIYRFEKDGHADYYDEQGRTTRKTLLKTPVDGARVSSGFGMRRHPILGYTKMHKGVDFAAPTGTPIYAAGDGTIDFVGRKNGYGNYIALRHSAEIKTAYAHMYRFASGMRRGTRVRQGDVIGYVGSTGRATGPHLHYEVVLNGRQVNPRSIDLPTGENLAGRDLARFKNTIGGLRKQYVYMTEGMKVAQNETPPSKNRIN